MAEIFFFTAAVALGSTLFILAPGIAFAWLLARRSFAGKSLLETFLSLPLVMPPVATGVILLELLGRYGPIGKPFRSLFDSDIVFTWRAVLAAMAVMSFPLLVRTARVAFEQVNPRLEHVARTLGASHWRVFRTITLPLAAKGIAAGAVLAFARALGEFGATVLVAGNIPGRTATLSVSIYHLFQLGRDQQAFLLIALSLIPAFIAVWISEIFIHRQPA